MILSTNAYNWAMLRSGLSMGDFSASLTPEREEELFKQYNAWRRSRGLPEEKAIETPPPPEPRKKPTPRAASNNDIGSMVKGAAVDDLSALITEVAAEVEEEEAEEAALVQNALDGADEIVEDTEPVPIEVEEEIEADESEPIPEEIDEEADEPEPIQEGEAAEAEQPEASVPMGTEVAAPEMVTTLPVAAESEFSEPATEEQRVDFTTTIRSLPKEPDPALYSRIKDQYGPETLPMVQAALKEATAKHRTTAAIRAFIAWLCKEIN